MPQAFDPSQIRVLNEVPDFWLCDTSVTGTAIAAPAVMSIITAKITFFTNRSSEAFFLNLRSYLLCPHVLAVKRRPELPHLGRSPVFIRY